MTLFSTVIVFAIEGFYIEIPVKSNKFRGQRGQAVPYFENAYYVAVCVDVEHHHLADARVAFPQ